MSEGFFLNEQYHDDGVLHVRPSEPYFAHGEGLFETLRAWHRRPRFLVPHLQRMRRAAKRIRIPFETSDEIVAERIETLLQRRGMDEARVKLHLLCRSDASTDLLITAASVTPAGPLGDKVALGRAHERLRAGPALSGFKTMNYLVNRLAEREGRGRGFDEVLFTCADGTVLEGTRSTVFAVMDDLVVTPPVSLDILPGVTRDAIIRGARPAGLTVHEKAFTWDAFEAADEAFLTSSVAGIRPVARIGDRDLDPVPGPLTTRLSQAYWELFTA